MVDVKEFLLNSNYHNPGLYNMQESVRNGAVDVKEEWVSELVTLHKRKLKKMILYYGYGIDMVDMRRVGFLQMTLYGIGISLII